MKRLLCTVIGFLALAPAANAATPHISTLKLSVEVTETSVDDWHYLSADKTPADAAWTEAAGSQTLGYSWKGRFNLVVANRALVQQGAEPYVLQPLAAQKSPKVTLRRSLKYLHEHHPVLCGGELGPCDGTQQPDTYPKAHCGTKKTTLVGFVVGSSGDLFQGGGTLPDVKWGDCPLGALRYGDPGGFRFKSLPRLGRLKKGQSVTLKSDTEDGGTDARPYNGECPELSGVGQQECSRTGVFVEVTRVG